MEIILRLNEKVRIGFYREQLLRGMILTVFCIALFINVFDMSSAQIPVMENKLRKTEERVIAGNIISIEDSFEIVMDIPVKEKNVDKKAEKKEKVETPTVSNIVSVHNEDSVIVRENTGIISEQNAPQNPVIAETVTGKIEAPVPEEMIYEIKVCLDGNGGVPAITEYVSKSDSFYIPKDIAMYKPGKLFDGWYMDSECTIPFDENLIEDKEKLILYAGWKDIPGFVTNEDGYATGYTDPAASVLYGVAMFPDYESCTGVNASIFDGIRESISEVFIPDNITYIEPGTFDGLTNLMYIEVFPGNPTFYSKDGVLYNNAGEVIAAPVWW